MEYPEKYLFNTNDLIELLGLADFGWASNPTHPKAKENLLKIKEIALKNGIAWVGKTDKAPINSIPISNPLEKEQ